MKKHQVTGGGGVKLHVVETGEPAAQPIVFIHGFSQSGGAWARQLESDLAKDHRLVALDLRGHGASEKPRDAYGDTKAWADDIRAVIQALGLKRPVLSGWSYGPLVALDYVRHYGDDDLGGLQFVGGISKIGSDAAMAVISPEFLALVPGFFSENAAENRVALESLIRLCIPRGLSADEAGRLLDASASVPSYVRQGLFARAIDNDGLLKRLRVPVLLTHGTADTVIKPSIVDDHKALIAKAVVDLVPGAPHALFWTDAPEFNKRLRAFCTSLQR
ncbi:MAG TPA: alpha/beta hydrolase [Verrucomicrobiae bacterium]|nr:alpha/beta hydrolase [Verrucomicrobiae bacterium]